MKRLIWSPEAERNLNEIADHIAADNPFAARRVIERIHTAAGKLAFMPSGRAGRVPGTHERPVRNTRYIIVSNRLRRDRDFAHHPYGAGLARGRLAGALNSVAGTGLHSSRPQTSGACNSTTRSPIRRWMLSGGKPWCM